MSDITVINDSEQSSLVTNGLAKNGELYLKASGSTDAGAIVVYDSGSWRTFANEASSGAWNGNTYSVDFDGSNMYVTVGNYSDYNFGSGGTDSAFSISAWINMTDATDFIVASKDDGGSNRQYSIRFVDDKIHFYLLGGGYMGRLYNTAVTGDQGSWIHVGFTYDGSKSDTGIKIYRNGTRVDDTNYSGGSYVGMSATSAPFEIGKQGIGATAQYSQGLIDEVAIFNSELSSSDVTAIYNSGVPGDLKTLSPVGWWRMGDTGSDYGTSTITDAGSGGNDGTLINGPTFSTDVPT